MITIIIMIIALINHKHDNNLCLSSKNPFHAKHIWAFGKSGGRSFGHRMTANCARIMENIPCFNTKHIYRFKKHSAAKLEYIPGGRRVQAGRVGVGTSEICCVQASILRFDPPNSLDTTPGRPFGGANVFNMCTEPVEPKTWIYHGRGEAEQATEAWPGVAGRGGLGHSDAGPGGQGGNEAGRRGAVRPGDKLSVSISRMESNHLGHLFGSTKPNHPRDVRGKLPSHCGFAANMKRQVTC